MTSHIGRLYALAIALLVFFMTWAAVAAQPWAKSAQSDPRLQAIAARERQVRAESAAVRKLVNQRWAVYRKQLKVRQGQITAAKHSQLIAAAAPSVRVVTLPPLTITRTS